MSKFKVGDKVAVLSTEYISVNIGDVYVVVRIFNDGVELTNGNGYNLYFFDSELELIKEEPKKFNSGKPRTDLISGEFILGLGQALQYGADKYGEDKADVPNYLKGDGHLYSDLIGSLERHVAYFKSGVNIDEESGLEHLLLAAVNAMFLYNYRISGKGKDNRVVLNEKK